MSLRRAKPERPERPEGAPRRGWRKVAFAAAVLVVFGAVAAAVALGRSGGAEDASSPAAESAAAPLVLRGADPITGKQVDLASFAGRPILLNIWASWCTGCSAEARALASFARAHPEAQVIGIDIQDTRSGARTFYRRFGWRHPSIFDPSGSLAARVGLQGLPTTIFLDRQHREVTRIVGETDLAGFEAGLREATT